MIATRCISRLGGPRRKLGCLCAATLAYVAAFPVLYASLGPSIGAVPLVFAVVAAALYGVRRGLLAVVPLYLVQLLLFWAADPVEFVSLDSLPRGMLSLAVMVALAYGTGWLVEVNARVKAQALALADREQALATLTAQLVSVQEEQRRALAVDLHNDVLQQTVLLARALASLDDPRARDLREMALEITNLVRATCRGLYPPMLDDLGLVVALETLAADMRARCNAVVEVRLDPPDEPFGRLAPSIELALFRVAQEALSAAALDEQASELAATLSARDGWVHLQVIDDGRGLLAAPTGEHPGPSAGLLGLRQQLARSGGTLSIERLRPHGTAVCASLPARAA